MISTLLSWMEFMFSHVDKFKYVTKTKLVIRYPSGYRESVESFVKIIKNFTDNRAESPLLQIWG